MIALTVVVRGPVSLWKVYKATAMACETTPDWDRDFLASEAGGDTVLRLPHDQTRGVGVVVTGQGTATLGPDRVSERVLVTFDASTNCFISWADGYINCLCDRLYDEGLGFSIYDWQSDSVVYNSAGRDARTGEPA